MNKAYGITASPFKELIDKINDFAAKNNVFSTQFLEPDRNTFYCVVWYQSQEQEKTQPVSQKQESKAVNPITEAQYNKLLKLSKNIELEEQMKKKNINSAEDLKKLSKKQAWELIQELEA